MQNWLQLALSLQILLAFFAPPVAVAGRTLFASDFWLWAWLPFAIFSVLRNSPESTRRWFIKVTVWASVIAFVVFIHGKFRPSFVEPLKHYLNFPPDDRFSFAKEFVVAFRFLTWFIAAVAVGCLRPDPRPMMRVLAGSALAAVGILVAVKLHPSFADTLGRIYLYNPHDENWAERIYGVFRSPVEGSITLGFALVLLFSESWARKPAMIATCALIFVGILLTRTITSVAAIVLTLALIGNLRLKKPTRWILPTGTLILAIGTVALFWNSAFVASKKVNFLYRFQPWRIYWEAAVSRADVFLLGTGFNPHFVDDIYVFLFNRGGIILLVSFAGFAFRQIRSHWSELNWHSRTIVVFLAISGLTVDNLIVRPVTSILIAVAIPMLTGSK